MFDTVAGDVATRSFAVLKPGGTRRLHRIRPTAPTPQRADVIPLRPAVGRDRAHLDRVAALYTSGAVRAPEEASMSSSVAEAN